MTKVFASWSGGKDGCLACYRAINTGMDVRFLANTITEDVERSCSHGMFASVIREQAKAIGIPLVQQPTTRDSYETEFKKMILSMKKDGVEGGVFGDIDFNPHREWIDRMCQETGIVPHLPLWLENQDKLMQEFIDLGFEAVVVAARTDLFGEEILGRKIDRSFLKYLEEMGRDKAITPCGEAGEYHTLVVDGPLFKKRLGLKQTERVRRDDRWFLEILKVELMDR